MTLEFPSHSYSFNSLCFQLMNAQKGRRASHSWNSIFLLRTKSKSKWHDSIERMKNHSIETEATNRALQGYNDTPTSCQEVLERKILLEVFSFLEFCWTQFSIPQNLQIMSLIATSTKNLREWHLNIFWEMNFRETTKADAELTKQLWGSLPGLYRIFRDLVDHISSWKKESCIKTDKWHLLLGKEGKELKETSKPGTREKTSRCHATCVSIPLGRTQVCSDWCRWSSLLNCKILFMFSVSLDLLVVQWDKKCFSRVINFLMDFLYSFRLKAREWISLQESDTWYVFFYIELIWSYFTHKSNVCLIRDTRMTWSSLFLQELSVISRVSTLVSFFTLQASLFVVDVAFLFPIPSECFSLESVFLSVLLEEDWKELKQSFTAVEYMVTSFSWLRLHFFLFHSLEFIS